MRHQPWRRIILASQAASKGFFNRPTVPGTAAEWRLEYPIGPDGALRNVEAHWMRQMGTLMINHGVTGKGRECKDCHDAKGIMDFETLGYPPERVADLTDLRELKLREKAKAKEQDKQM